MSAFVQGCSGVVRDEGRLEASRHFASPVSFKDIFLIFLISVSDDSDRPRGDFQSRGVRQEDGVDTTDYLF